ncbi:hypothetical protein P7L53_09895 [Thermoleptolyngbya sichuanensis XZ-Cy5]|nr:hypothetical protein [Thermoleptolyngbya sichuanensis]MDG2616557.1 hypothetical protein [Thermoleptolyngbya sichuanensis XZ-Cy5]
MVAETNWNCSAVSRTALRIVQVRWHTAENTLLSGAPSRPLRES